MVARVSAGHCVRCRSPTRTRSGARPARPVRTLRTRTLTLRGHSAVHSFETAIILVLLAAPAGRSEYAERVCGIQRERFGGVHWRVLLMCVQVSDCDPLPIAYTKIGDLR